MSYANIEILKHAVNLVKINHYCLSLIKPMNIVINSKPKTIERLNLYIKLVRLHKPVGTVLLLWPMLIALWVAGGGHPPLKTVVIFIVGCFLMRSSGCAINDFADRKVDGHVHRTKQRPLATQKISPLEAVMIYGLLAFLAFLLVLCTNTKTTLLSFAALFLATLYPFMKRLTHAPQLFLGFAFAWAIPMSYTAVINTIPIHAWLLYAATACWALAYDTQYALVDMDDDKKIGVKSTAVWLGHYTRYFILTCHVATAAMLSCYAYYADVLGVFTGAALVLGLGLVWWQDRLVKSGQPQQCFKAFLNNQWLGAVWFIGFLLQSLA